MSDLPEQHKVGAVINLEMKEVFGDLLPGLKFALMLAEVAASDPGDDPDGIERDEAATKVMEAFAAVLRRFIADIDPYDSGPDLPDPAAWDDLRIATPPPDPGAD